jgi:K+-sensing histidine kinase KdpD
MTDSPKLPEDVRGRLRALTHDLSNAVEVILQAAYLLGEANLDVDSKKWTELIEKAADDAARINREIRETLR